MKRADDWEEIVQTWVNCPHCFRNVQLPGVDHRNEDDIVGCPNCGEEFELGDPA